MENENKQIEERKKIFSSFVNGKPTLVPESHFVFVLFIL